MARRTSRRRLRRGRKTRRSKQRGGQGMESRSNTVVAYTPRDDEKANSVNPVNVIGPGKGFYEDLVKV